MIFPFSVSLCRCCPLCCVSVGYFINIFTCLPPLCTTSSQNSFYDLFIAGCWVTSHPSRSKIYKEMVLIAMKRLLAFNVCSHFYLNFVDSIKVTITGLFCSELVKCSCCSKNVLRGSDAIFENSLFLLLFQFKFSNWIFGWPSPPNYFLVLYLACLERKWFNGVDNGRHLKPFSTLPCIC